MARNLKELEISLAPLKSKLFNHSLYSYLKNTKSLRCFMSHHVFAVWDFMNLLSYLQSVYTTTSSPWKPPEHPKIARLLNEIKCEEETDCIDGAITSHFEFYVSSMKLLDIEVTSIELFISQLGAKTHDDIINIQEVPACVKPFLTQTIKAIKLGPVGAATSLAFGRETIIPKMFLNIISNLPDTSKLHSFKTYLERHIELDGEEHADLSRCLVEEICGDCGDLWDIASETAESALKARITLYSAIEGEIKKLNE